MLVDFGRAGWIDKARQQPEKVRQVLDKIRTDGLMPTLDAVRSKLDQPLALGYCNVRIVQSAGAEARGFTAGDRVVSNGPHAEVVAVPANLGAQGARRRFRRQKRPSRCSMPSRSRACGSPTPRWANVSW